MNFLKLTRLSLTPQGEVKARLSLTLQGEVKENVIFVNPQHIRVFCQHYADNFDMDVTAISWNNTSFNETHVKETPSQILEQLKL